MVIVGKFFEYEILVNDRAFSKGRNLKKMWEEARKKYPTRKLSIRYIPPEGILIAVIRL